MCDVIEFDGADYRHAGEYPDAKTLQELWKDQRRQRQTVGPTPRAPFTPDARRRQEPA